MIPPLRTEPAPFRLVHFTSGNKQLAAANDQALWSVRPRPLPTRNHFAAAEP